jgi:hypothetical protein
VPDESSALPTSRIARWTVIAALIAMTVVLYFHDGRRVPPLTGAPAAAPTSQPAN